MSHIPKYPNGFYDENFQRVARYASDNKECIRLVGLSLLQKKLSEVSVANLLGVHPQTVFSWLQRYKLGGTEAIKDQGDRGRKSILNKEQEDKFKNTVLDFQKKR